MEDVTGLSRLSISLEIIGFLLAWGDARKPLWYIKLERVMNKIANSNFSDVIECLPFVAEYVVFVFVVIWVSILGHEFRSDSFKYFYILAIVCSLMAPVVVKRMRVFSGGNAITTLGLMIAAFGICIQLVQYAQTCFYIR